MFLRQERCRLKPIARGEAVVVARSKGPAGEQLSSEVQRNPRFLLTLIPTARDEALISPPVARPCITAVISKVDIRNFCNPITNTRLLLPASPLSVSSGQPDAHSR
jgi:hypothetical protein